MPNRVPLRLLLLPFLFLALNVTARPAKEKFTQTIITDTLPEIKGSVRDEKGDPVSFASVIIKGTDRGTMVDKDGNFSLKLPPNSHYLTITCIGYQMQTIPVSYPSPDIKITLKPLVIDTSLSVVFVAKKLRKKNAPPVAEEKPNSTKIFPNPLPPYSRLTIEWEYPTDDDFTVEIFDLRGNSMQKQIIDFKQKNSRFVMQLSLKASGDYMLRIVNKRTNKIYQTQLMVI